jgi:hypothetical protein
MSLVALGSQVMTTRGIVPVEHIMRGDMVLTSNSRFRPVSRMIASQYEGELVVIDQLALLPTANLFGLHFQIEAESLHPYGSLIGVDLAEWEDGVDRCARGLKMRGRGMMIEANQGAIVLGISPLAILGSALLAMRADSHCTPLVITRRNYKGTLWDIGLRDREFSECAVYDRFPVLAGPNGA